MEVEIDPSKLTDSPFDPNGANHFVFDKVKVHDFVNDVKYGLPTCYLISGYRGVGKTSFIKRVEHLMKIRFVETEGKNDKMNGGKSELEETKRNSDKSDKEMVFVYTNFNKQNSHTHIIRKLIRELYLTIREKDKYKNLLDDEFKISFELLYQRTFKDISETSEDKLAKVKALSFKVDLKKSIIKIFYACAPLFLLIPWYIVFLQQKYSWIFEYAIPFGLLAWAIFNTIKLSYSFTNTKTFIHNVSTKSLFDDEIAGTLFFEVLDKLKQKDFKVVFVLDELDKVLTQDLDSLINELKPYLVCGRATFIVIGGQDFYYKFHLDENVDDAVLSSIFSKVYHIPLVAEADFTKLFFESIVNQESLKNLTEADRRELNSFIFYLIFMSRLVPRRFITRLRQNISWKGKKAFLSNAKAPEYVEKCETVIKVIDRIDDESVSPDHAEAVRDYILMKLYIKAQSVFAIKTRVISADKFTDPK